jgi:hydroxymethylbilane synthase
MTPLKLGTRGSQLALFQANTVAGRLQSRAGVTCEIAVIRTSGDRLADAPLAEVGGKRLFVKEIEDALLGGAIDLAVHSSKDMPAILPDGLVLGAVLPREDARDAVVLSMNAGTGSTGGSVSMAQVLERLGSSARIGTSSIRRTAQLTQLFPQARFSPVRGNLDTRLRKLDGGEFDALVLAAAGLIRLGHANRISLLLPHLTCVPAPGQGIIAVEVRGDDDRTLGLVKMIDDAAAAAALTAERAVVARLGGGCQMPIGAYAQTSPDLLRLTAIVISVDGSRTARAHAAGPPGDAARLGARAAEDLLAHGARDILAEAEQARAAVEGLQP